MTGKWKQPKWKENPRAGSYYQPSYNISPTCYTPVIVSGKHFRDGSGDQSERVIVPMRWALVPSWYKGKEDQYLNLSNCRSEGMLEKPSFRGAFTHGRRCVVVADGFYEWQRSIKPSQPYFCYSYNNKPGFAKTEEKCTESWNETSGWSGRQLLTMAGIFDVWKSTSGCVLYSYSVITVDAPPSFSSIHHRIPALLDGDDEVRDWLNFSEVPNKKACSLCRPNADILAWHKVSTIVNNSRNQTSECVKVLSEIKSEPKQQTLMDTWIVKSPKKRPSDENTVKDNKFLKK